MTTPVYWIQDRYCTYEQAIDFYAGKMAQWLMNGKNIDLLRNMATLFGKFPADIGNREAMEIVHRAMHILEGQK